MYREGRYIEAAEMFELTEQRLAASDPAIRAEYGLYRGLTFLRLDDLRSAREWLSYAFTVEQSGSGLLDSDEHTLLDHGWKELEQRSRAAGSVPSSSAGVVAETEAHPPSRAATPGANGHRSVVPE